MSSRLRCRRNSIALGIRHALWGGTVLALAGIGSVQAQQAPAPTPQQPPVAQAGDDAATTPEPGDTTAP